MSQGWSWPAAGPGGCQQRYPGPAGHQQHPGGLQQLGAVGQSQQPPEVSQHQQLSPHSQHQQLSPPQNSLPSYKSGKEATLEDSSAVVSSTQDEPDPESHGGGQGSVGGRYTPGGTPEDGIRGAKQDHFGNLIGIISDLQESPCLESDISYLISTHEYNPGIKTESEQYDAMSINPPQTELEYLTHPELQSSNYNRQHSTETGYRYRDEGMYGVQYPTHLPLKSTGGHAGSGTPIVNHQDRLLYSPVSPEPGQGDRPRDDKYWERRRKNNLAAKKSRDARRVRENQLRLRVLCSENQIRILRSQLEQAKETIQDLKKQMRQYEGDSSVQPLTGPCVPGGHEGGAPAYESMEPNGGGQGGESHDYHDLEPPDKDRMVQNNGAPTQHRYQEMDTRYGDHIMNGGVG